MEYEILNEILCISVASLFSNNNKFNQQYNPNSTKAIGVLPIMTNPKITILKDVVSSSISIKSESILNFKFSFIKLFP